LANSEETPPHIRLKASRDWLNLMGMNMPVARGGSQDGLNKGTLVAIQQVFNKENQDSGVIDAEVLDD